MTHISDKSPCCFGEQQRHFRNDRENTVRVTYPGTLDSRVRRPPIFWTVVMSVTDLPEINGRLTEGKKDPTDSTAVVRRHRLGQKHEPSIDKTVSWFQNGHHTSPTGKKAMSAVCLSDPWKTHSSERALLVLPRAFPTNAFKESFWRPRIGHEPATCTRHKYHKRAEDNKSANQLRVQRIRVYVQDKSAPYVFTLVGMPGLFYFRREQSVRKLELDVTPAV